MKKEALCLRFPFLFMQQLWVEGFPRDKSQYYVFSSARIMATSA